MPELFDKHGGFRRLHSFTPATIVQIEAQGKAFEETGGVSKRLMAKRIEAGENQKSTTPSPDCPQCGKPMRQRRSVKGDFLGCSTFPECKGTRAA